MVDGSLALCILVTLVLVWFIFWGRSARGQKILRQTLGEPYVKPKTKPTASGGKGSGTRPVTPRNVSAKILKSTSYEGRPEEIAGTKSRTAKAPTKASESQGGAPVTRRQSAPRGRKQK